MKKLLIPLIALAMTICGGHAAMIIGNSPAINRTGHNLSIYDISGTWSFAVGFRMEEPDFSLTSFTADLRHAAGYPGVTVTAGLYANDGPGGNFGGDPGTLLALFGSTNLTSSFATYQFDLVTPYNLSDNTRYFIMLTGTGGAANWSVDNGTAGMNGQIPTSPGGEATWMQSRWVGGGSSYTDTRIPTYSIFATAIPEPSTYAMLLMGGILGCVMIFRSSRRAKAAVA
ncbi:choice-of-anchor R domain-containing protein [Oscillatoria laete-virens NRMC-F 0139]|nr:choice-of-anchor R domain-containing protein [Oscillatoria laete-virens]MDL5052190.1 choice-of-anchor R domain-containing protein [Oscillatoria laete-virens NRMC-F 0139]